MTWALRLTIAIGLLATTGASAQIPEIRGYYLHVASGSADNSALPGGVVDFQRLRVMSGPSLGPVRLRLAYEQALQLRSAKDNSGALGTVGALPGGTDWIPLQGVLEEGDHARWSHRVDRLSVTVAPSGAVELTVGRQTISWATTLFLTPADPFVPFDPAEPFREYRAGVDAVRLRGFPGNFTEIEVVVRPSDTPLGSTMTAVTRGRTVWRGVELALWAGAVHDDATAGFGTTITVAGAALRGEGVVRRHHGETLGRVAIGADRRFSLAGNDLYVLVEYQRDGFGAGGAADLVAVVGSDAFARRELQVLGRDAVAVQGTYQPHPLLTASMLGLVNLNDSSVLAAPAATYSAGDEVTLRAGVFLGFGTGPLPLGLPGSEYGSVPTTGYVSVSLFF